MGESIGYICKKCKEEKEILYGIGFLDDYFHYENNNFEYLISRGTEEKLKNMTKLLKFIKYKNVHLSKNYGNDAYICPKCKNIINKFRYALFSNNRRFFPKYKCNYCNSTIRLKKKNEDFIITCDNCGSKKFEKDVVCMDWD